MKTFKNMECLEKRLERGIAWEDYFSLGGRMYDIYEYGPGPGVGGNDYVYFLNKRSGDMIYIQYICPSSQDGVKVNDYRFISVEKQEGNYLWR